MSHIIEIDTAKQAAIYIEKMHDRKRFFITKDSDEHYPPGAWLSNRIAQFVARFKLPSFSRLGEQYVDVLLDKGFDYRAVHTAYDAACKKHNISTSLLEWLESRRHDPNQPSNWPDNYYQGNGFSSDVHLLEGVKAIRVGRWIEALTNVVDESGRHVGVLVRCIGDDDRTWIEHVIELDHLSSDGSAMFQALEECGYRISGERKARAALRQLIQGANIGDNDPVIRYSRPGWHGDVQVLPTGVTSTGVKAFVAGGVGSTPGGTYDEWCEHVRDQVWQGDTPQFAVGMLSGLAGIVSSRLACDHPVIYFSGETGSGKSTSQIVGGGVVADPNEGKGTLFGVS